MERGEHLRPEPESVEVGNEYFRLIEEYEQRLDEAYANDPEEYGELFDAVPEVLAEACDFLDKDVYVRGNALIPVDEFINADTLQDGGVQIRDVKQASESSVTAFIEGIHATYKGVHLTLRQADNSLRHQLRHVVQFSRVMTTGDYGLKKTTNDYYASFDKDSRIVLCEEVNEYLRGIEGEEPSIDVNRVVHISRELIELVNSTGFRRIKKHQQRKLFEDFIHGAQSDLEWLRNAFVTAEFNNDEASTEPGYFYVPSITDEGPVYAKVSTRNEGVSVLQGTCIGVVSVDEPHDNSWSVRRDSDLLDKHAGLCLALEIIDEEEAAEDEGAIVLLPIAKGKQFDRLNVRVET